VHVRRQLQRVGPCAGLSVAGRDLSGQGHGEGARGFGHSTKPPHTLSLAELAESLADWMSATGLDRAVLLGNSLGCQRLPTSCAVPGYPPAQEVFPGRVPRTCEGAVTA